MDDPRLHDYNVDDVIRRFKAAAEDQRKHFRGNNIMMTMGSDFQYRNADMWYKVSSTVSFNNLTLNLN